MEFIYAGAVMITIGLGLLAYSSRVSSHGEKFKMDYRSDAQTLHSRSLQSISASFLEEAIYQIEYLSKGSENLANIRKQMGETLLEGDSTEDVTSKLWDAMAQHELSVDESKDLRESLEEIVSGVRHYEEQRKLFHDAWSKEVEAGRRWFWLAILFIALGFSVFGFAIELPPPIYGVLAPIVLVVTAMIGGLGATLKDLCSAYRKSQEEFIKKVDTEIYNIEPMLEGREQ